MRWVSDDERLHASSEAPETPKTVTLLASSLRKEKSAQYLPFEQREVCAGYTTALSIELLIAARTPSILPTER